MGTGAAHVRIMRTEKISRRRIVALRNGRSVDCVWEAGQFPWYDGRRYDASHRVSFLAEEDTFF